MRKKKEGGRERGPGYNGKWIGMTSQRKKKNEGGQKFHWKDSSFTHFWSGAALAAHRVCRFFFFFFQRQNHIAETEDPNSFVFAMSPSVVNGNKCCKEKKKQWS